MDIVAWLATVIVGGAIAGWITHQYQTRSWRFQERSRSIGEKNRAQVATARELFQLVDRRLYASRIYLNRLLEGSVDDIKIERSRYQNVVFEWNEKISGLLIVLSLHYSYEQAYDFENYFLSEFSEIDEMLGRLRKRGETGPRLSKIDGDTIKFRLNLINVHARNMMRSLFNEIQLINEIIEEKPRIKKSNAENLRYTYLLKALFKSRRMA